VVEVVEGWEEEGEVVVEDMEEAVVEEDGEI